jgi:osmotically inducible protein OsmC
MAVESSAEATWEGDLVGGRGTVRPASGTFPEVSLTWRQRAETRESGTSPEELIAAAHAGCFAMALSFGLGNAGHSPERVETTARVAFQPPEGITGIRFKEKVPGIDERAFIAAAEDAKANCRISKALAGDPITLEATLQ